MKNTSFIIFYGRHFEHIEEEYLFRNPAIEQLVSEIIGKPFKGISYKEFTNKKDKR